MPRTDARGGPDTRRRIAGIASRLFLERGFDRVTVADVAREAGVSSVTVFKHFPRKEDLFLDRSADAIELVRSAIRDREKGIDPLDALRASALGLLEQHHALSGIDPRSAPFFRTVADSPALVARSRELLGELQGVLADELRTAGTADPDLVAALIAAGYAAVFTGAARRILAGGTATEAEQRERVETLFGMLRSGIPRHDRG